MEQYGKAVKDKHGKVWKGTERYGNAWRKKEEEGGRRTKKFLVQGFDPSEPIASFFLFSFF